MRWRPFCSLEGDWLTDKAQKLPSCQHHWYQNLIRANSKINLTVRLKGSMQNLITGSICQKSPDRQMFNFKNFPLLFNNLNFHMILENVGNLQSRQGIHSLSFSVITL